MVLRVKFGWKCVRSAGVAAGLVWVCFLAVSVVNAQAAFTIARPSSNFRLLTSEEGRAIVNAAWEQNQPAGGSEDCSHVVHEIYVKAGFEYAYASSFDIYAGNENFARVKTPQAGDLIVWPGHVGIMVDPLQHSFYSLVSTGFDAQDYQGLYWKSRGKPRFYRFNVERVEIKRDHGWAHLQIDSKVSVSANGAELKKRREKVRWELRRTESGWEAVPPPDRTYVPRDMAVKNLAGQLARLTQSGGAAENQEALLRQESQLASLLSVLLNQK